MIDTVKSNPVAEERLKDMFKNQYFSHYPPSGETYTEWEEFRECISLMVLVNEQEFTNLIGKHMKYQAFSYKEYLKLTKF